MSGRIRLVIGPPNSGKTTRLLRIIAEKRDRGFTVGGFVALADHLHGRKTAYRLVDQVSGESRLLCHRIDPNGLSPFVFDGSVFSWAAGLLGVPGPPTPEAGHLIVVDEWGRLEAEGRGHAPAVRRLLAAFKGEILLAVRADCEEALLVELGAHPVLRERLPIKEDPLDPVVP